MRKEIKLLIIWLVLFVIGLTINFLIDGNVYIGGTIGNFMGFALMIKHIFSKS